MSDGSHNGNGWDPEESECLRLGLRVDELDRAHRQRVGQLEDAEIRLEARHGELRADIAAMKSEVNALRHGVHARTAALEMEQQRQGRVLDAIASKLGVA